MSQVENTEAAPKGLQVKLHQEDDLVHIGIGGVFDEENNIEQLTAQVQQQLVVVDTSDIWRMNSCGVRDWVNWLSKLRNDGCTVVLARCSPAVIGQLQMVRNFLAEAQVLSFFVQYFCPNCEHEDRYLVDVARVGNGGAQGPPALTCERCKGAMELDDQPGAFEAILGGLPPLSLPAELRQRVEQLMAAEAGGEAEAGTASAVRGQQEAPAQGPSRTDSTPAPASGPPPARRDPTGDPVVTAAGRDEPAVHGSTAVQGSSTGPGAAEEPAATPRVNTPYDLRPILYVIAGLLVAVVALVGYLILSKS